MGRPRAVEGDRRPTERAQSIAYTQDAGGRTRETFLVTRTGRENFPARSGVLPYPDNASYRRRGLPGDSTENRPGRYAILHRTSTASMLSKWRSPKQALVEPVQKKCSFLNSVIGLLQLHGVSTFAGTIEQYAKQALTQSIDAVVVRALKYDDIQKHIPALLTEKGKVILYRTSLIENKEIGKEFHRLNETTLLLPHGSGKRVITVLEKKYLCI